MNFTARGKTGLIYLVTQFVTADTSATIASVVEEAVDDVEEEDKEAQESKNCIRVKHISEIIIGYQSNNNLLSITLKPNVGTMADARGAALAMGQWCKVQEGGNQA